MQQVAATPSRRCSPGVSRFASHLLLKPHLFRDHQIAPTQRTPSESAILASSTIATAFIFSIT